MAYIILYHLIRDGMGASVSDFERFFQFSATRTPPEAGDAHDFRGQVEDHSISLTVGVGIFRGP